MHHPASLPSDGHSPLTPVGVGFAQETVGSESCSSCLPSPIEEKDLPALALRPSSLGLPAASNHQQADPEVKDAIEKALFTFDRFVPSLKPKTARKEDSMANVVDCPIEPPNDSSDPAWHPGDAAEATPSLPSRWAPRLSDSLSQISHLGQPARDISDTMDPREFGSINSSQSSAGSKNAFTIGMTRRHSAMQERVAAKARHRKFGIHHTPVSSKTMQLLNQELTVLQRFVSSKPYDMFVMLLVTFNAIFIGYQVQDYALRSAYTDNPEVYSALEPYFLCLFTVEALLRVLAYRCRYFKVPEWKWNVFDILVLVGMWVEALVDKLSQIQGRTPINQVANLRVLRVMRIVRILRVIRVLKFFRELRLMLSSILNSMLSLFWAMTLLSIMFYIFGLSLTQGCVDFLNDADAWDVFEHRSLRDHFGSLDSAVLSLFEAMAGGISWGELVDALGPLNWNFMALFLFFISLAIFAVLNIVTGVFVQTALERTQKDKESLIQNAMTTKENYLHKMYLIFRECDTDHSNTLSFEELEQSMEDERMSAYLEALGLDCDDVDTLFVLLDRDGEGHIDIHEFLTGCLKLKGEAKGLDIAIIQYQTKWLMHNVGFLIDLARSERHLD